MDQKEIPPKINLKDLDYDLPRELIAQYPEPRRDACRLLVFDRKSGQTVHTRFKNILDFLNKDDIMILNNTRVFPARLFGRKKDTGARIEVLLLEKKEDGTWEAILRPARRIKPGTEVLIKEELSLYADERREEGRFLIHFSRPMDFSDLEKVGSLPLPPYVEREPDKDLDGEYYQTVYAKTYGAVAAPTAGFHFTDELLDRIRDKGVRTGFITLHISYATFTPIRTENVLEHKMHREYLVVPGETADLINQNKGAPVIAVGTTVVRGLEAASTEEGKISPFSGYINTFIRPGYQFKVVDRMITNFHLPKSTLLLLVSAMTGLDRLKALYQEAIREKYRFFSYGDAMMVL